VLIKNSIMKIKTLLFAAGITALLLPAGNLSAQLSPTLEQRFQDTLNYMQSHYQVRGVSASVSIKGQGIWKGAAGFSKPGIPLNSDMLIGIGSNTKTFVSAMMLKLYENGQVDFNDTIGNWIQGYPNISGAITIKQVLNHRSGLFSYTEHPAFWDSLQANPLKVWTKEEILNYFVDVPSFAPGTDWEYSNTNYDIAGIILEAVSGRPVHALLRDSILNPLQLGHTFYPPDETPAFPMAGFWGNGGMYILPLQTYSLPNAAGALVSTPEDVVHFWEGLFNGDIISKQTLNTRMLELTISSPNGDYGYGLGIYKDTYFGNGGYSHGGTWLGQINSNFIDTVRGITICVLSNQDSLKNEYTDAVVAALYSVMLNPTGIAGSPKQLLNISFYPNPASDLLTLGNDGTRTAASVALYGIDGRQVYQHYFKDGEEKTVDVRKLSPGMYIAEVVNDKGQRGTQKITITR
jgi:D-alanyl-D-alanine carboxypeptidase